MNFGEALAALKLGKRISRSGWNGKGMWIVLIDPDNATYTNATGWFVMQPCIGMKTADNKMQPGWLASQMDLLAEDWEVLP